MVLMSTLIALYFFFNYPVLPCPCTQFQSRCHSGFIYALSATLFLISMQCSIFAFPLKFCVVKKWLDFEITYVYIHPPFSTHDILKCHNSMLHCKQKLLKDRYLLQLLINTFELFEKKMIHVITYSDDTFLCENELGDFISFSFHSFLEGGGVTHFKF